MRFVLKMSAIAKVLLLLCLAVSLPACSPSKEKLAEHVKQSMQAKLDADERLGKYGLEIQTVTLVQEAENKYKGMADVKYDGQLYPVSVDVVTDDGELMWQVKPMAFGFILAHELRKVFLPLQEEASPEEIPNESRWAVQIASLSNQNTADSLVKALKAKAYNAYIVTENNMSRIFVGPYSDRQDAEEVRQRISREDKLNGFIVRHKSL